MVDILDTDLQIKTLLPEGREGDVRVELQDCVEAIMLMKRKMRFVIGRGGRGRK